MKLEFTGRHIEVTPALREHVEDHFKRIEHLFNGKPVKAHVIIEVSRGRHRSEIVMNWWNETLTAVSTNSDMYLSLSQSVDKIEKQARRIKEKVIDKSHKARRTAALAEPPERAEKLAPVVPSIIETNGRNAKPMTTDEAVLELEDGDKQFVVFRDAAKGGVAVLFKRKDGNLGLIRP
jgi:putative sigma-54 modulation protein